MTAFQITKKIGILIGLVVLLSYPMTVFGMQRSSGRPLGPCQNGKNVSGVSKKNTSLTASRSFGECILSHLDSLKSLSIDKVVEHENVELEEVDAVESSEHVFLDDEEGFVVLQRSQSGVVVKWENMGQNELIEAVDSYIGTCINAIRNDRKTFWAQCSFDIEMLKDCSRSIECCCEQLHAKGEKFYQRSRVFDKSELLKKLIALIENSFAIAQDTGVGMAAVDAAVVEWSNEIDKYNDFVMTSGRRKLDCRGVGYNLLVVGIELLLGKLTDLDLHDGYVKQHCGDAQYCGFFGRVEALRNAFDKL